MEAGENIRIVLLAQGNNMAVYIAGTEVIEGDMRLGHMWHEVEAILDVLDYYQITHFIEIGVHEGGLTWILLNHFESLNYLGIDINLGIARAKVKNKVKSIRYAELIERDCFARETIEEVQEWMPDGKPCLIYCDNGNKPKEILFYAPIMRIGDILMAHDYHDGRRIVRGLEWYGFKTGGLQPEVCPEDVVFMYKMCEELEKVDLSDTRIIGFMRYNIE